LPGVLIINTGNFISLSGFSDRLFCYRSFRRAKYFFNTVFM
jgi:hypothetical protein